MKPFPARLAARLLTLTFGALAALAPPGGHSATDPPVGFAGAAQSARVIVKYRLDADPGHGNAVSRTGTRRPQHAAALASRLGIRMSDGRVLGPRTQALHASGMDSEQLAQALAAMPGVEWAVPDKRRTATALPNDPLFPAGQAPPAPAVGQWHLRAADASAPAAIDAAAAWDLTHGAATITVAVLDTGVRAEHPDLAGKLHPGYDFVNNTATAGDGNGRDADPADPGDNTAAGECGTGRPSTASSWHGTQVAGLLGAASNNGIGVAGVARDVMVLPVRVLGRCGGFDSDIIAAMRWAAGLSSDVGVGSVVSVPNTHPARVINMSLGSQDSCAASYREVIAELLAAGVAVVAAAGNENGLAVNTPANCPGAIAVAGLRHSGTKVGYSSLGPEVSIAAPAGNCVNLSGVPCLFPLVTTSNDGVAGPGHSIYTNGVNASLGTSFSAPLVAGTIGLMLSVNPGLAPAQLKAILQATARPFPATGAAPAVAACHVANGVEQLECYCTLGTCGAGMLSAGLAVTRAQEPAVTISATTRTPAVGSSITLDGSAASASLGRSLVSYAWRVLAGAQALRIAGASNQPMLSLSAAAAGEATVELSVTDNLGASSVTQLTLTVLPLAGGGGGGAWGPEGLLLLPAAALAWHLRRRRTGRMNAYTL